MVVESALLASKEIKSSKLHRKVADREAMVRIAAVQVVVGHESVS